MPDQSSVDRLTSLLGYDPSGNKQPSASMFQEVLEEVKAEKLKTLKVKAKEQLLKAIEVREQKAQVDRKYKEESAKFEKTLGKIIGQLEAMANGREIPEDNTPQE